LYFVEETATEIRMAQGQLIERGEDRWLVRVYAGRDSRGRRNYVNQTVRGSKKEAQRVLTKLLGARDSGTLVRASRETVRAYLERWLDTWAKPRLRIRTHQSYRWLMERYVLPVLGDLRLSQLTPADIQHLYNRMAEGGLSTRTIRYTHSVLRSALVQAVRVNLIVRNPADLTEPPRLVRREMKALGPVEAAAFLKAARDDRWYAFWLLLLTSGLRPGEALGLKWSDLDGSRIRVQRVLVPGSRGRWRLEEPKTAKSRRVVALPESVARGLQAHRRQQAEERLRAGELYQDHGLVFATSTGTPPNYRGLVLSHFDPILKRAGLPPHRPYDLRHSAATLLLAMGEHPKVVSERLGHSSVTITLDTYSHVLPDMQERAAARLDALLSATVPEVTTA
jgi:integrase